MRVRTAAPLVIAAVVAAGSLAPAQAAPKKKKPPIKKSYSLTLAPLVDATEVAGCDSAARTEAVNMDTETIKVTGAGVLTVKVSGFYGDWDASLLNSSGAFVASAVGTSTPNADVQKTGEDVLKYKSKKAQTLSLRVCNFLGSQTASVSYTYVYL